MRRKNRLNIVFVTFFASLLAANAVQTSQGSSRASTSPVQAGQAEAICVIEDLRYSVGAYVEGEAENYRCVRVLSENAAPAGVAWVPLEKETWEIRQPSNEGSLCILADSGRYSVGAYVPLDDSIYRCVNVRGVNLESLGAMWIEVVSEDGIELPA